jgi:undecaprenyl-diphosphatase
MNWSHLWMGYKKHLSQRALARLFWLGFALFFLGIFLKLTWELREDLIIDDWDKRILVWIANRRIQKLNGIAVDITALGSPSLLLLFTVLGSLGLSLKRDWWGSAYLVGGSAGAGLITFILKHFFSRSRPDVVPHLVEVTGYSYPSGHSLAATAFYLLVMFLLWRGYPAWSHRIAWLVSATSLILVIGFSRIYLGVHYPSDVLSGILLGAAWSCVLTSWYL